MNLCFVGTVGQWNVCQGLSLKSCVVLPPTSSQLLLWLPISLSLPSNHFHLAPTQAILPMSWARVPSTCENVNSSYGYYWDWRSTRLNTEYKTYDRSRDTMEEKKKLFPTVWMRGCSAFSFCTGPRRLCNQPWSPIAVINSSWATLGKTLGSSKISFQVCKIRKIPISLDFCEYERIHAKRLSQHLTHFNPQYCRC